MYYSSDTVEKGACISLISFDNFIMEDGSPIYLQILGHIKRGVVSGAIKDGDELPSRRVLSALLGVNPNTVQKAYRMLEEEELICSHSGAKSYMLLDEEKVSIIKNAMRENDAMNVVHMLRRMGVSREEALDLINDYWDRSEEK